MQQYSSRQKSDKVNFGHRSLIQKRSLGKLQAIYHDRQFKWSDLFTLFLPGLAAWISPLIYGFYLVEDTYYHFGPAMIIPRSYGWFILSFIAFLIFLGLLFYRLILARSYIALFQHGLIIANFRKNRFTWDQISAIKTSIQAKNIFNRKNKPIYQCTISFKNRKPFHIRSSIQSIDELITRIKSQVYPHRLKELQNSYALGNSLHFGQVTIKDEGLEFKRHTYLWNDIRRITIHGGKLVIEFAKLHTLKIPVGDIPNIELLLEIIQKSVARI